MFKNILKWIKSNPQFFILIILIIGFSFLLPAFLTSRNLLSILRQVSTISLISFGLTIVMIGGNLDLSVGSTLSFLAVLSIRMQVINPLLGVAVPIIAAILIGFFNGYIVQKFNINSIIVTLGSMLILAGIALITSNSRSIQGTPGTWFSQIAEFSIYKVPMYVILFLIIAVIYEILLRKTLFGRSLIYQGTNRQAAILAGQNVNLTTIISFMVGSVSVAFAAIIMSSRMLTGNPISGQGIEFDALTAILLGGISLRGGQGNIFKTMVGVLLLAVIYNALNLFGVPFEYQNMAKGLLITIAIISDARLRGYYAT